jgi:cytochrome c556
MRRIVTGLALAALAAGGIAAAASAQAPTAEQAAQNIIITRKAGYDLMSGLFSAMRRASQANQDVKPFEMGAAAIVAWSKQIPLSFPPGSETGNGTRAKPEIWSDRAGFEKAAASLQSEAEKLEAAAKAGDQAAFATQVKAVEDSCNAGHRTYRARSS